VGWHISKIGDRWAALEPHSGVRINVQNPGRGTYPTSIYPASDCGRVFTLFINGQSPNQIAKTLTVEGALT